MKVIAVDISGRHRMPDGKHCTVCVAVSALVSPLNVQRIEDMRIVRETPETVDIDTVVDIINKACTGYDGVIIAEAGDLYNYPEWRAEAMLGRKLKYAESIGERKAIETAHHISLAVHRLLKER